MISKNMIDIPKYILKLKQHILYLNHMEINIFRLTHMAQLLDR